LSSYTGELTANADEGAAMVNWRTNEQLAQLARELGTELTQIIDNDTGAVPNYPPLVPGGAPSPNPQKMIVDSVINDAIDFTSLEPQKIADEYQRMQHAASDTGENYESQGSLKMALARLSVSWHGDAADAFARQMSNIEEFMEQQQRTLLTAAQGMGTAFGLAVHMRESYGNLAENTIAACRTVLTKQHRDKAPHAALALGVEIVKAGVKLADVDSAKKLKDWAIDRFFDQLKAATEDKPIDDSGAAAVVDSYARARDQLKRSFADGLNQLRDWLNDQGWAYIRKPIPLLAPLPGCTDVRSPDFSYARFFSDHHDAGTYIPKVDQERKKYLEEHPPGLIAERLDGER
jgi:uncharacterized protein YukE